MKRKIASEGDKPVRVVAAIEDIDTGNWQTEIEFTNLEGARVRHIFDYSIFAQTDRQIAGKLREKGARLPVGPACNNAMKELASQQPPKIRRLTRRAGWHGLQFVLPDRTIGKKPKIIFAHRSDEHTAAGNASYAGALEAWLAGLKEPLARSSYLTFALALGFTTPIASLCNTSETAIFHFWGESSSGKTLGGRICTSVIGRARKKDLLTFRHTNTGIEDAAARASDTTIVIDEADEFDGNEKERAAHLRKLSHTLTAGLGKMRSDLAQSNQDLRQKTWSVFGLTSGEMSLEQLTQLGGGKRTEGAQARFIDVHVPPRVEGGCFDRSTKRGKISASDCRRLFSDAEKTISTNYGRAIRPWITYLLARRKKMDARFAALVDKFVRLCHVEDPWEERLARKFGYAYASGVIAVDAGLMPCSDKHVRKCILKLFRRKKALERPSYRDVASIVRELQAWATDPAKIVPVKKGVRPSTDKANGYRRLDAGLGDVICLPAPIVHDLCGSAQARREVYATLKDAGVLVPGQDGVTRHHKIKGVGRHRYVTLRSKELIEMPALR